MDNEKEIKFKMNLLFISIPLSGLAALLRYRDFYKSLEFVLLLFILSVMTILYSYISNEQKEEQFQHSLLSTIGFIIITSSSVIADYKYLNLFFLFVVSLLAIYSELNFSLLTVLSYAFLMTLLGIGTKEFTVLSLLSAIFILILTRFYSDIMSLFYVILTIISLNVVGILILNNLDLSSLSVDEKIIDIGIVIASICFSYILFLNKKRKDLVLEAENMKINSSVEGKVYSEGMLSETETIKANGEAVTIVKAIEELSPNEEFDYEGFMDDKNPLYVLVKSNQTVFEASMKRARICSEIAKKIGADNKLAAAGGFFSDCGKLYSNNYIKESLQLIKQYGLPNTLLQIAKEHHFKFGYPSSKEAAIVMILFKLESSISFFEVKGKFFPSGHVVNNVTDTLLMSGKFDKSKLEIQDYKYIKDYLTEEVLKEYDYFSGKGK